jgi:nitroimidazol reductase NimA-like FMN-containing flavoprotein (pyridoxamine 5'-phosphate oxidase superfamily)
MAVRPRRQRARNEVDRIRERGSYDREAAYAILDAGLVAHVGFAAGAQPFVIPMLYARDGDALLLHGSVASRLTRTLADGIECCVAVTHLDGLVLARSHFHHSANYRSVVAFGRAVAVTDPGAKVAALARFVEFVLPGRAADTRAADPAELAATTVLHMPIADLSAKVRTGGVKDHPDDLASAAWAGVLPLALACGAPLADSEAPLPDYLARVLARGIERR